MIGVGITVHNRNSKALATISKWKSFLPDNCKLVIVDDASKEPIPNATFRFEENVGIAVAKNKCIELLEDCEHIFLSDDDCYPVHKDWHFAYINSGGKHLSMTFTKIGNNQPNGNKIVGQSEKFNYYSYPCGCMIYIHNSVIKKIGGIDEKYIKWGYEHVDFSRRAFNAGLTEAPYMDIKDSHLYFESLDQKATIDSSVPERKKVQKVNDIRFRITKNSSEYYPYKKEKFGIVTSYFNSGIDPQRKIKWAKDISQLAPLLLSCKNLRIPITLYTDCFSQDDFIGENVKVINVIPNPEINICDFRFTAFKCHYEYTWIVDSTDVEVLKNPFENLNHNKLYIGYEHGQKVGCEWMVKKVSPHLQQLPGWNDFLKQYFSYDLLNCGVIGGHYTQVLKYLNFVHSHINLYGNQNFPIDMGLLNYYCYTQNPSFITGQKVVTKFKHNEYNSVSFFKHK